MMLFDTYRLAMPATFELIFIGVAFITLLLSCFMVYRRLAQVNDKSLTSASQSRWRMVYVLLLNIIAFVSLLALILTFDRKSLNERFDMLISAQASSIAFDSELFTTRLIKAEHIWLANDEQTIALYQEALTPFKNKISLFSSTTEITTAIDLSKTLRVYGDGLTAAQWQHLPATPLTYIAAPQKLGFVSLHWRKQQNLGESLVITGQLQRNELDRGGYRIELRDGNDNVIQSIDNFDDQTFSLSAESKATGVFTYQLVLIAPSQASRDNVKAIISDDNKAKVIAMETIAFSVKQRKAVRLLIKQSAPSFETRKLKQWASEAGSEVLVLTTISQNKALTQSINHRKSLADFTLSDKNLLTAQLLAEFDLLIIDTRAFFALSIVESEVLITAISQGLGMLILADDKLNQQNDSIETDASLAPLSILDGFDIQALLAPQGLASTNENNAFARWPGSDVSFSQPTVSLDIKGVSAQVLVEDENARALVARLPHGLGHVAVSLLPKTYQWGLLGEQYQYSLYWQFLLSQVSRNTVNSYWLAQQDQKVSYVRELQQICLQNSPNNFVSHDLELITSLLRYRQACGDYVALASGWKTFSIQDGNTKNITSAAHYFYPTSAFSAWRQIEKQSVTRRKTAQQPALTTSEVFHQMDKTLVWLIFLLTSSLLWIERKWLMS